jgi:hypothetical protein
VKTFTIGVFVDCIEIHPVTYFSVDWYIKNRVVLATVESDFLTIEEIENINKAIIEHIHASDAAPVHVILDCWKIEKFQMNIALVNQVVTFVHEPKLQWIVIISDDKLINTTAAIVTQIAHAKLHNAADVEEAAKFLRKVDPTLVLP